MVISPLAYVDSLRIGTVDFVSPDQIKVLLEIDAPDGMALNAGVPRAFPKVNGYVLIRSEQGFLVAQVEWITIERSQYPKRRGMQDFGLVDLPYPLRKMSLNPLGMLCLKIDGDEEFYEFSRGVNAYPTVGDPVLLPTEEQLRQIVESGKHRRILIGHSPLANHAEVRIDPDRLFGRHLAVLGNTGSGKSCSVSGLIRWSLESAKAENQNRGGRFIILDPNGEYAKTFEELGNVQIFSAEAGEGKNQLSVPLWLWNSEEWCAFTQASAKVQRPLLQQALRDMKAGRKICFDSHDEKRLMLRRYLSVRLIWIRTELGSGAFQLDESKFGFRLRAIKSDLAIKHAEHGEIKLDAVVASLDVALSATFNYFSKNGREVEYYRAFKEEHVVDIINCLEVSVEMLGGVLLDEGPSEDTPIRFDTADLADHLETLGQLENASQYVDFLVSRIRTLLADTRMKAISDVSGDYTLQSWLQNLLGPLDVNDKSEPTITVIDLSLVPAEVVHIVTAVIARMTLEALQRYRKTTNGDTLPTVLVMEEAHTFVKRYKDDAENRDSAAICCQVFEKIAREGRKFGLGLVLSSQRPSELSPTVLSQCNSFLLHRISNDRDQELVQKLVPDNLRGLLRDLPSLPSRQAILLGWAAELPTLVTMRMLEDKHQPKSSDPEFWNAWKNGQELKASWDSITKEWQQLGDTQTSAATEQAANTQADVAESDADDSKAETPNDSATRNDFYDDDIPF